MEDQEQQAHPYRLHRDRPKGGRDRKPQWHEIGAIWPHKNGSGFDLVIPEWISVAGRIVCTERKAKPAA